VYANTFVTRPQTQYEQTVPEDHGKVAEVNALEGKMPGPELKYEAFLQEQYKKFVDWYVTKHNLWYIPSKEALEDTRWDTQSSKPMEEFEKMGLAIKITPANVSKALDTSREIGYSIIDRYGETSIPFVDEYFNYKQFELDLPTIVSGEYLKEEQDLIEEVEEFKRATGIQSTVRQILNQLSLFEPSSGTGQVDQAQTLWLNYQDKLKAKYPGYTFERLQAVIAKHGIEKTRENLENC